MVDTLSEVAQQREQAELIKERFLANLSELSGRDQQEDDLTRRIYESAKAKGIDVGSDNNWITSCAEMLLTFRQQAVPNHSKVFQRIIQVMQGRGLDDLDARLSLEWAREYFNSAKLEGRRQPSLRPSRLHGAIPVLDLATCLLDVCFIRPKALEEAAPKEEKALAVRGSNELALHEREAQANLGKSIRVLATVLGSLAFLFTGSIVIIPLILVAWVMAYALIDERAIRAQRKQLALTLGEPAE